MDVSVVVPVYNSELALRELASRIQTVLETSSDAYELILVNDGSRDRSAEVIHELCSSYPWIRGLQLMRNYGQHNALLCGIRAARYEITITIDDDLQHPPEEIPKLLGSLTTGFDVVYGRPDRAEHGLWRELASRITKIALQSTMGVASARHVSAFRAFRTGLREAFEQYQGSFVSIDVLLTWATTRFTAVTVLHEPRRLGESNYTFGRLVRHALNMMTGFSSLPLQMASLTGFAFTLLGFCLLILVLGRYFQQGGSVPGFPFLASMIAIFSGAQLFALGIIGEYLARMHFRMMDRPPYVVREEDSTQPNAHRTPLRNGERPSGSRKTFGAGFES